MPLRSRSRRRVLATLAIVLSGTLGAPGVSLAVPGLPLGTKQPPTLVVLGDSVSAGYGLSPGQGWVSLLKARLAEERYPHRVVNASISGDTTAGGLARLPAVLKEYKPTIVVVELGGNDALRGQPLAQTRTNLEAIVARAKKAGAKVLLVGMRLPPNYGGRYVREFDDLYRQVANDHKLAFVPYLFDGFGENLDLFQADRIHPTSTAQPRILNTVWPTLKPLLGPSA
jgi:acyl-CoA thioesterase-1